MTQYYNVYINHDPAMTLTYFMASASLERLAFTWQIVKTMDFFENYCSLRPEKG